MRAASPLLSFFSVTVLFTTDDYGTVPSMKMNCTIPYTVTVQVANTIKTSTQHHLYLYYQGYRGNLPIYKSVLKHSLPVLYCWYYLLAVLGY